MFAARFCRCQTVLCIGAAGLTLGTPVRTEPRTNPFHFQVKLSGHSLRPKSKLCHIFQISLRGANLRVFFRTASVLFTVRIRRVASTGEVTPIIGEICERDRDSMPYSVVPCQIENALERMELGIQRICSERHFESCVWNRASHP